MLNDNEYNIVVEKINTLQASVNIVAEMLLKMQKERVSFGDWVPEKEVMEITGLSRSTLLKMRNSGKIRSSTISGKQPYYNLSDFKKQLDINQQKM